MFLQKKVFNYFIFFTDSNLMDVCSQLANQEIEIYGLCDK